jgi:hypothetical protein
VWSWLDVQDEINKRASKHLHLVSVRQTFSTKGSCQDPKVLKTELAKPDGHLEFDTGEYGKDFGVIPTMDMAESQFRLLQEAKQEIDAVGVHAALSGAEGRDLSGKAISRLQEGSSTEIKPVLDALAQFNHRIYVAVWNRVKQFWTEEKWVRVTDDEDNLKWVGLNRKVTLRDQLQEQFGELPPEIAQDPRLDTVVGVENKVAEMDVDIVVEDVPDTVTIQQEQFDALTAIFPAIPDNMKPAAFEMLIESSTVRNKSKFLEKLKGQDDPQAQAQQAQLAEMQQQLEQAMIKLDMAQKQANVEKTNAEVIKIQTDAEKNMADTEKTQVEAAVELHKPIA